MQRNKKFHICIKEHFGVILVSYPLLAINAQDEICCNLCIHDEIHWGWDLNAKKHEDNMLCVLYSQIMKVILHTIFSLLKEVRWEVDKMDDQVKKLAARFDNLSLISGTSMVEGENLHLTAAYVLWHAHALQFTKPKQAKLC